MTKYLVYPFAFLLFSCSSTVNVQVLKKPAIELNGVQKIAIGSFKSSGSLDLDLVDRKGGLAGALLGVAVDVGTNAALTNERQNQSFDNYFVNGLKSQMIQNGSYQVVESSADATLRGNVIYHVRDQRSSKEYSRKDGSKYTVQDLDRTAQTEIQLEVVAADGHILGAQTIAGSAHSSAESENINSAREQLAQWDGLVREALSRTWLGSVHSVAPYKVYERRTLAKGDSKYISKGNDAAEDGDWTKANQYWQEAMKSSVKDQAAAQHNLAIKEEVQGNLNSALESLLKARALSDDSSWFEYEMQLRNRIANELAPATPVSVQSNQVKDPELPAPQPSAGAKSINQAISK